MPSSLNLNSSTILKFGLTCLLGMISSNALLAQSNELVVDVIVLKLTPGAVKQVQMISSNVESMVVGQETVTIDKFSLGSQSKNGVPQKSNPTTDFESRLTSKPISNLKLQQILAIANSTKGCSVKSEIRTSSTANQPVAKLDGKQRTFCVSYRPEKTNFGNVVDTPVYKVVQNGTIANNCWNVASSGINLDSTITINQLVDLETFTYGGTSQDLTIYMPTCKTRQLKFSVVFDLANSMLLESSYGETSRARFSKVEPNTSFSKVPYINRLFKKHQVEVVPSVELKSYILVSAYVK